MRAPKQVGPWTLVTPLGQGGMGVVWRAEGPTGAAAVKLVARADREAAVRFEREARAILDLRHPNIVRALDFGATGDGALYLAMELLAGESLADRVDRAPLPPAEAARIARGAALGLAAAHAAGFVHRDVKPGNVFLCVEGTVKVLDFGLVLRARKDDALDERRLTEEGYIVGTVSYMAPEQAANRRTEDARTDVWALGATLYHALTGRPPFEATKIVAELVRIVTGEPDPLPAFVPFPLATAIRRALQKDVAQRFPTMLAFADALDLDRWADAPTIAQAAPEVLTDEVRLVSVVFAEGIRDLAAFSAEIERRDGTASALRGDRAVGLFGGSGWRGDEPERAVRAALAARAHVRRLGVGTGKAMGARQGAVAGVAVDGARAALAAVEDGQVGADEETRRLLVLGFDLEGPRVLAARPGVRSIGLRTIAGADVPLCGRDAELRRLTELCDRSFTESAAMSALVVGPPGIGKSRLLLELLRWVDARADRPFIFEGHGESHRMHAPFAMLLRSWARLPEGTPNELGRERIRALVEQARLPPARELATMEFIGELLKVPWPQSPRLRAARADPQVMRDRIVIAIGDLFEGLAAQRPVIFALDDIHWSDVTSLQVLALLLARLHDRPLFVLGTTRPDLSADRAEILAEAQRLELRELSARDTATIVSTILGRPEPRIVERAGGNPYFAEELALAVRGGATSDNLPLTVHGAVQARLDGLPPAEKDLLKRASVFGRRFWTEALVALGHADAANQLAALRRRDLVAPRSRGLLAGANEWVFRHAVVEEVARGLLLPEQATALHRLAAAWMRARLDAPPDALAAHLDAAGQSAEATPLWLEALSAADAGGESQRVLDLADRLAGRDLGDRHRSVALQRAGALFLVGRLEDALGELHRLESIEPALPEPALEAEIAKLASTIAAHTGRREAAVEYARAAVRLASASGRTPLWGRAMIQLERALGLAGRVDDAAACCDEISDRAGAPGQEALRPDAALARATIAMFRGQPGRALPHFLEAAALFESEGDSRQAFTCSLNAAVMLGQVGQLADARRRLSAVLETARRLGLVGQAAYGQCNLGMLLLLEGDHAAARVAADLAHDKAVRHGDARLRAYACVVRSLAFAGSGDADAAIAQADAALEAADRSEEPGARTARAIALLAAKRPGEALEECERALAARDAAGGMEELGIELLLCHRDALAALGRADEAEAALATAHRTLLDRLDEIADPEHRRTFIANLPAHARVWALVTGAPPA